MKIDYLIFVYLLVSCVRAYCLEEQNWASQALARIQNVPTSPSPDDMEFLCTLASQEKGKDPDKNEVYQAALSKLQGLGNIENEFQAYLEGTSDDGQNDLLPTQRRRRLSAFRALGMIRHPDALKVLGPMLSKHVAEERHLMEENSKFLDHSSFPSDGMLAARSLHNLIRNPPVSKDPSNYLSSDVIRWRVWWDEVSKGARPFSFRDDTSVFRFGLEGQVHVLDSGIPEGNSGSTDLNPVLPEAEGLVERRRKSSENAKRIIEIIGLFVVISAGLFAFIRNKIRSLRIHPPT